MEEHSGTSGLLVGPMGSKRIPLKRTMASSRLRPYCSARLKARQKRAIVETLPAPAGIGPIHGVRACRPGPLNPIGFCIARDHSMPAGLTPGLQSRGQSLAPPSAATLLLLVMLVFSARASAVPE